MKYLVERNAMSEMAALYSCASGDHLDEPLLAQKRRVADYCADKHLETSEALTFNDSDTSFRIPLTEREGGAVLLQRILLGDVSHVVVAKFDPLGRSVNEVLNMLKIFDEARVCLHIVDVGGDTITTQGHMGRLVMNIFASIAKWDVAEIRDRTIEVLHAKARRGELTGTVPFGWDCVYAFADGYEHTSSRALNFNPQRRNSKQEFATDDEAIILSQLHGVMTSRRIVRNEAEQAVIADARQWRSIGSSLRAIAYRLNELGIRSKLGVEWSAGNVVKLLNKTTVEKLNTTAVEG